MVWCIKESITCLRICVLRTIFFIHSYLRPVSHFTQGWSPFFFDPHRPPSFLAVARSQVVRQRRRITSWGRWVAMKQELEQVLEYLQCCHLNVNFSLAGWQSRQVCDTAACGSPYCLKHTIVIVTLVGKTYRSTTTIFKWNQNHSWYQNSIYFRDRDQVQN